MNRPSENNNITTHNSIINSYETISIDDISYYRTDISHRLDINVKKIQSVIKEKLMHEPKINTNLFRIYCHFFDILDWIFLFFAVIGSIGSGLALPVLLYTGADNFSPELVKESMSDEEPKKQLKYGAVSFVCNFLNGCFWLLIGIRCSYSFKKKYFILLLSQEQGWFDSYNVYELANKVQAQIEQFEQGIGLKVGIVLSGITKFVGSFVFSFLCSWKITLVMACISPIAILLYAILTYTVRKGIIVGRRTWENAGGIAEELFYNIKTVASFANFEYELMRFYEKVEIAWKIDIINAFKLGFFNGIIVFLLYSSVFICFIYGRTLVYEQLNIIKGRDLTGGDIFCVGILTIIGLGAIGLIAPNIKGIQDSCVALTDYFNLYHRKSQIDLSQSIQKPQIRGKIEFSGVNFSYPSDPEKRLILNNINLTFEQGKKIALIGESGCGKSTTVNLIERLYDITGGQLLIDGIEINKYDIEHLRNSIGYVHQEPVLFNTSIRNNIIFGRKEYLSSIGNLDELIKNACDISYSSEFINNLNDGLDYIVGIKGSKLSGGQKQRIAIARAILTRPKILIFDEATSALDYKSEIEIQRALDNISQNKVTIIIIAHRLTTIKNVDFIYVLKDGKVLEKGTHNQLLETNGYYTDLFNSQFKHDEIGLLNENEDILKGKINIKRNSFNEDNQFETRDNEISLSKKDIPVRFCSIIAELSDYKLDIFLACLGALITGLTTPFLGFMAGKISVTFISPYQTIRYDGGLKQSFAFFALAILIGVGNLLMIWKFMSLGVCLTRIYRKKLMKKYLSFHLSYFDVTKNSPGSLLTKMSINTMELSQMVTSILGIIIQCSFTFIVGLIIGFFHDIRLILVAYVFIPIIIIFNIYRRNLIESSSKKSITANIEAGGILSECIINTKTVFSFNFQREAIRMYLEVINYFKMKFVRDAIIMGLFMGLGYFCYFGGNALVSYCSNKWLVNGSLNPNDMVIILDIASFSIQSLAINMSGLGNLKKAKVAFGSIYSTLCTKSLIPPFKKSNEGKISAINIKGKIEFKNVYFKYPTRPENAILKGISFTVMPGQNIAFIGSSGSGKSTIIQLLERFYDIEEGKGEILIDDINIKDYNLYELRKKIGIVSQEPSIFRTSPLENVRYGRLTASDEECIEAAKEANILSLFNDNKMIKIIDEQKYGKEELGKNELISGGEKQRLCLARTFLKNPTILLLDEVTSSLDKDSELEIQKSLEKIESNRTCISITHRLNTIEKCDQIYYIDNGRIIENGTHQELMNLRGMYYKLKKYSK